MREKKEELFNLLKSRGLKIAFAESCTGGMLSAAFCSTPGVSEVFEFAAVTYSNRMKTKLLNVPEDTFSNHGAVSLQCAREMALGIIDCCDCDIGVSVTGIAGPDGGTADKPVGTVWVCGAKKDQEYIVNKFCFAGQRDEIRHQAVIESLNTAIRLLTCKTSL